MVGPREMKELPRLFRLAGHEQVLVQDQGRKLEGFVLALSNEIGCKLGIRSQVVEVICQQMAADGLNMGTVLQDR